MLLLNVLTSLKNQKGTTMDKIQLVEDLKKFFSGLKVEVSDIERGVTIVSIDKLDAAEAASE